VIEFASELVLEEDSVMELTDDLLSDNGVSDELESQSFSVIHNAEMRSIFAQEALIKLNKIDELLKHEPLEIREDDDLSIALHTLLGNARTLELSNLAKAYGTAENLCLLKQENGKAINDQERATLSALVAETRRGIQNGQDEEPYYDWDAPTWEKLTAELQAAVEAEQALSLYSSTDLETVEETAAVEEPSEVELDLQDTDAIEIDDDLLEIELSDGELVEDLEIGEGDDFDIIELDEATISGRPTTSKK